MQVSDLDRSKEDGRIPARVLEYQGNLVLIQGYNREGIADMVEIKGITSHYSHRGELLEGHMEDGWRKVDAEDVVGTAVYKYEGPAELDGVTPIEEPGIREEVDQLVRDCLGETDIKVLEQNTE